MTLGQMPGTSGSRLCFKVALVVINALFFAIGALLLGVGGHLFTRDDLDHYSVIGVTDFVWSIRVTFIICGCLILFITALGCVAACCENRCLIILYEILLCLLLLTSLSVAILTFVYYGQIQGIAIERAAANIREFYGSGPGANGSSSGGGGSAEPSSVTASVDAVQVQFKCCGWSSGSLGNRNVFLDTPWYRESGAQRDGRLYPDSCCAVSAEDARKLEQCTKATDEHYARSMGYMNTADCVDLFVETNGNAFRVTVGITVVAIFLQIWCIVLAGITLRQLSSDTALVV